MPAAPPSGVAGPRAATNSLPRSRYVSLRSSSRFSEIYRIGNSSRKGGLAVLSAPNGDLHTTRIGFVAGRKVGNAVHRNRAKRRLREAARRVDLPPATDLIVIASPSVNTVAFHTLVDWLSGALGVEAMSPKEPS